MPFIEQEESKSSLNMARTLFESETANFFCKKCQEGFVYKRQYEKHGKSAGHKARVKEIQQRRSEELAKQEKDERS